MPFKSTVEMILPLDMIFKVSKLLAASESKFEERLMIWPAGRGLFTVLMTREPGSFLAFFFLGWSMRAKERTAFVSLSMSITMFVFSPLLAF